MFSKIRKTALRSRHRAKVLVHRKTAPPGSVAALRSFDEQAARIAALLAADSGDFSERSAAVLELAQTASGAVGSALFRAVQDTGMLVPVVRGVFKDVSAAEREDLAGLMAKAADSTAISLLSSLEKGGVSGHPILSLKKPFQRRSYHGGRLVIATAIIEPPTPDGVTNLEMTAAGEVEAVVAPADSSRMYPAQMLGIWITVARAGAAEHTAPHEQACGGPYGGQSSPVELAVQRLYPFIKILLRQQIAREFAESAKRQSDKRIREVATIYEIGKAVDSSELDTLLQLITRKAASVMDAQACSLMLKDDVTDQLAIAASFGLPDEVVENTRVFVGEGIAGRVAMTGEPLLVNYDVRADPRFRNSRMTGLPGISSSISVPMKDDYMTVQGVLCIRRRTPAPPFTEEDERLFAIFATQASMAIKNAKLYGLLRSRVQELSTLSALTEAITSTLDLDYVLNQLADNLIQVVGFDRCVIYLRTDDEGVEMSPRIARGFDDESPETLARRFENPDAINLIHVVAGKQVPVLVEDDDDSLPLARSYAKALGLGSFYAQPIVARNDTIGVLVVTTDVTRQRIALSNLELLVTFLQHAGIAIENARLYKQMEQRIQELNTLYSMSRALTTTYGLSRSSATINRVGVEITQSDATMLLVFNERRDTLRIGDCLGLPSEVDEIVKLLADSTEIRRDARAMREPITLMPSDMPEYRGMFGLRWSALFDSLASTYSHLMLVPLVNEEANVGFLILARSGSPYRPEEFKLASIISSQAAAVLRGAAIYEHSVEQRVLELSALYELSKKVRSARSISDAMDSIIDIVSSVVICDDAAIYVVDRERRTMRVRAFSGDNPVDRDRVQDQPEQIDGSPSIAAWVVREGKAILSADITADTRFVQTPEQSMARSAMVIPFFVEDDALAVLQVQSATPNLYTEDNVKMLSLIAAQAAALYREMQSLRELTTYTDNVLQSIPAGVVTLDAAGRIVTYNAAAQRLLHLKGRDVLGITLEDLMPHLHADATDREDTLKMVAMALETGGTVQRHGLCYFNVAVSDAHEPVIVNGSASQLLSERGEYIGVVLVFEDITKEQEMAGELQRISRLAEIGQLAAGIAHELRNPLTSIKGAAQVVLEDMPVDPADRGREFLKIIVNEVNVLSGITSEFLEFSKPGNLNLRPVALNDLLASRIKFMKPDFERNDIAVREVYEQDLGEIQLDANLVDRVSVNILLNAIQAMPNGGLVTVITRRVDAGTDRGVEIEVADTGIGIGADQLRNIFTPFFTTKTKGTGLGLAIVQKTIDMHGGRIRVKSAPGEGTTFTIWLPSESNYADKLVYAPNSNNDISEQRQHAAARPLSAIWNNEDI